MPNGMNNSVGRQPRNKPFPTFYSSKIFDRITFGFMNPVIQRCAVEKRLKISEMEFEESPETDWEKESTAFEAYWNQRKDRYFVFVAVGYFLGSFVPLLLLQLLEHCIKLLRTFSLYV